MPGDVGLVAKFLSELFGFATNETGYAKLAKEHRLKLIREGIREAINQNNGPALDAFFDELRDLLDHAGP